MNSEPSPDLSRLIRVVDFARKHDVDPNTVKEWHRKGRWNRARTRIVKLVLHWGPWNGYGILPEDFEQFMQDLNTA